MTGHPLHPIAVHFPVVLLIGGVLVDVVSAWLVAWRKAGFFHLVLGTIAALAALLTGGWDARSVDGTGTNTLLRSHTVFAILTTLAYGLMAAGRIYFRIRHAKSGALGDPEANVPVCRAAIYFAFAAIGVILMVATGFTGGGLVYGQSVSTIAGR